MFDMVVSVHKSPGWMLSTNDPLTIGISAYEYKMTRAAMEHVVSQEGLKDLPPYLHNEVVREVGIQVSVLNDDRTHGAKRGETASRPGKGEGCVFSIGTFRLRDEDCEPARRGIHKGIVDPTAGKVTRTALLLGSNLYLRRGHTRHQRQHTRLREVVPPRLRALRMVSKDPRSSAQLIMPAVRPPRTHQAPIWAATWTRKLVGK